MDARRGTLRRGPISGRQPRSIEWGNDRMHRRLPLATLIVAALALTLSGCAEVSQPAPALSPVTIKDFASVAGKWAGRISGLASRREEDDQVNVVIGPDGTYEFGIYRTIGVASGKGTLTLQDGKLAFSGERGAGTLSLFEGGGKRVLRGNGVLSDGTRLDTDLSPAR